MDYFNFKERNLWAGSHLIGLLLIVAGSFAIISPLFFDGNNSLEKVLLISLSTMTIGLIIVCSYGGTLIDFNEKKTKEYYSFCGFQFGTWTELPDISTVSVVSFSNHSTNIPNGISSTFSGFTTHFHVILLANNSDKPPITFEFSNKDSALEKAKFIADKLNVAFENSLQD